MTLRSVPVLRLIEAHYQTPRWVDGVKLDNHVQIAHNAVVGDHTAMASYSGLAGSANDRPALHHGR